MNFYSLSRIPSFHLIGVFFKYYSCSYDHELKIQKARENARRTEKEKDAERYETMMHDFLVKHLSKLSFNANLFFSRIKQWLMNVDKMNFDENLINFINPDNSTKLYKRRIMKCMHVHFFFFFFLVS